MDRSPPRPETIAAIATPPGRGGIGVVRLSGPLCADAARALLGFDPPPRRAAYAAFRRADGSVIDRGLALRFAAPHSYTGEDVLELHGHGGPVVLDALLARALEIGARRSRPGEFTERAFLNGKLDLAQAEAVADLIDAASSAAARGAVRSLDGALSRPIHVLVEAIAELRVQVEASIDFDDEDIETRSLDHARRETARLLELVERTRAEAARGVLLASGVTVVIAGRANVGKSTLLNALAGRPLAIVTDVPGTTRDAIRERLELDGLPLELVDTAGLRVSADAVERIGVERAWAQIESAGAVLWVVDDAAGIGPGDEEIAGRLPPGAPCVLVRNKCDLTRAAAGVARDGSGPDIGPEPGARLHPDAVRISAREGLGLDALRKVLKEVVGYSTAGGEDGFSARQRHVEALDAARASLAAALAELESTAAVELVAENLRLGQDALSRITGAFTTEDLLERIFSSFCIGK